MGEASNIETLQMVLVASPTPGPLQHLYIRRDIRKIVSTRTYTLIRSVKLGLLVIKLYFMAARKRRASMKQYNPGSPFERIAIEITDLLPKTADGNKYILVVVDYFGRRIEAYVVPN